MSYMSMSNMEKQKGLIHKAFSTIYANMRIFKR